MDPEEFAALVEPGAKPAGPEDEATPDNLVTTATTVAGVPAVHARYTVVVPPAGGDDSPEATDRTEDASLLLHERDAVLILLLSAGYETTAETGATAQLEPLSESELVAIAESLEPAN